ncbi:hypothetical protein [Paracoccus aminophilus]|uniref:Lipoprotein n=1 Tax=Paracoccus aminophilus JCM 7686 TaxID=1367847 RepID=S5YDU6_PARAH|nr:hypothetical protein [Paracoccus aminophilus]AGT09633.1 hypothetical protein JCM7686_2565 [Paracoccus aminophilus JCM 7686]
MVRAGISMFLAGAGALMLSACAPQQIPVAQAEQLCLSSARDAAAGPRTEVGFGAGSHGFRGGFISVGLSGDSLMGRDPSDVYARCVLQRSGQMPSRPLYQQPGWGGR